MHTPLFVWFMIALSALPGVEPEVPAPDPRDPEPVVRSESTPVYPTILLADSDVIPSVRIGWMIDGEMRWHKGERPLGPPSGGDEIAPNLTCYAALGGTRVETGAGHHKGLLLRLGLTKIENAKPMFAHIEPGTDIVMELAGVRLNQPIKAHEHTGLMHLKYSLGDLEACALPGTARNQYLMTDPEDTLGGRVIEGVNATPGGLDGGEGHGEIVVTISEDQLSATMLVRVPYAMLRHLQDPWDSDLPGTFFEPIHLHAETELIPVDAQQLDRDPIPPTYDPTDPRD